MCTSYSRHIERTYNTYQLVRTTLAILYHSSRYSSWYVRPIYVYVLFIRAQTAVNVLLGDDILSPPPGRGSLCPREYIWGCVDRVPGYTYGLEWSYSAYVCIIEIRTTYCCLREHIFRTYVHRHHDSMMQARKKVKWACHLSIALNVMCRRRATSWAGQDAVNHEYRWAPLSFWRLDLKCWHVT